MKLFFYSSDVVVVFCGRTTSAVSCCIVAAAAAFDRCDFLSSVSAASQVGQQVDLAIR